MLQCNHSGSEIVFFTQFQSICRRDLIYAPMPPSAELYGEISARVGHQSQSKMPEIEGIPDAKSQSGDHIEAPLSAVAHPVPPPWPITSTIL